MGKKDFKLSISQQWENKNESVLENKLNKTEDENNELRKKLKEIEKHKSNELAIINIKDLHLLSNIRDNLEYEEIDTLAENIKKHGQLQPVLITQDNYLLAGYRRYHAIKFLHDHKEGNGEIIYHRFNKNHKEISDEELKELQFAENEQRREIDYFQLSKLYSSYKENSILQKDLTEIFKKSKGTISAILKISHIDSVLVNYLKQFQIYAWSKNKFDEFAAANFNDNNEKIVRFYYDNKGIIGWRPLYEIAKHDNLDKQKEAFLKFFSDRLTETELAKDFVITEKTKSQKDDFVTVIKKTSKQINSIIKSFESFDKNDFNNYKEISEKLKELNSLIKNEIKK